MGAEWTISIYQSDWLQTAAEGFPNAVVLRRLGNRGAEGDVALVVKFDAIQIVAQEGCARARPRAERPVGAHARDSTDFCGVSQPNALVIERGNAVTANASFEDYSTASVEFRCWNCLAGENDVCSEIRSKPAGVVCGRDRTEHR